MSRRDKDRLVIDDVTFQKGGDSQKHLAQYGDNFSYREGGTKFSLYIDLTFFSRVVLKKMVKVFLPTFFRIVP